MCQAIVEDRVPCVIANTSAICIPTEEKKEDVKTIDLNEENERLKNLIFDLHTQNGKLRIQLIDVRLKIRSILKDLDTIKEV